MLRIYFNRRSDFPFVWSVDNGPGTEELNFVYVVLDSVRAVTKYRPKSGDGTGENGEDLLTPRAWFEIADPAELIQADEVAIIKPAKIKL